MKVNYLNVGDYRGVKPLFRLVNDADVTRVSAPARYLGLRQLLTSPRHTRGLRPRSKGFRQ